MGTQASICGQHYAHLLEYGSGLCDRDESPYSHPTGAPAGAAPLLLTLARFHSYAL